MYCRRLPETVGSFIIRSLDITFPFSSLCSPSAHLQSAFSTSSFQLILSYPPPQISSLPLFNLPLTTLVEMHDNDEIQYVHPFQSKNVGKKVSIQAFDLSQYSSEVVFVRIDQVKYPNFPLCNVLEIQCRELLGNMPKNGYDYSLEMITILLVLGVNHAGAAVDRLMGTEDDWMVLKGFSNQIILDLRHGNAAIDILCKTGQYPWTAVRVRTHLIMQ